MQIRRTPNSRLVYAKLENGPANWQSALARVESYIHTHPRLSEANQSFYIYFFKPGREMAFDQQECWVAREVIGFATASDDIFVYDLDAGTTLGFPLHGPEELPDFAMIFQKEAQIRGEEKKELADTWRVHFREGHGLPFISIEFFKNV